MTTLKVSTFVIIMLASVTLYGTQPVITSYSDAGQLEWTSPSLNVTCHTEWATSLIGGAWSNQQVTFVTTPSNITTVTSTSNEIVVAKFYRLVTKMPDPHFQKLTPTQSLTFINFRSSDTNFVIIDVRTSGEYNTRHIINALNINRYASNLSDQLDALDKNKQYLIYCNSGNRSGYVHGIMLGLNFHEVYDMVPGMNDFPSVPGADAVLVP